MQRPGSDKQREKDGCTTYWEGEKTGKPIDTAVFTHPQLRKYEYCKRNDGTGQHKRYKTIQTVQNSKLIHTACRYSTKTFLPAGKRNFDFPTDAACITKPTQFVWIAPQTRNQPKRLSCVYLICTRGTEQMPRCQILSS